VAAVVAMHSLECGGCVADWAELDISLHSSPFFPQVGRARTVPRQHK
jgi:hypothetical protein